MTPDSIRILSFKEKYLRQLNLIKPGRILISDPVNKIKRSANTKKVLLIKTDAIGDFYLMLPLWNEFTKALYNMGFTIDVLGNEAWKSLTQKQEFRHYIEINCFINTGQFVADKLYREAILKTLSGNEYEMVIELTSARQILLGDSIVRSIKPAVSYGIKNLQINITPWWKHITDCWYSNLVEIPKSIQFESDRMKYFMEQITKKSMQVSYQSSTDTSGGVWIFPTAGSRFREWDSEKFCQLYHFIEKFRKVKVGLAAFDESRFKEIMERNNLQPTIFNSIEELENAIYSSELVICHDSAPLHIAQYFGKKIICISNGNHYRRFQPYPTQWATDKQLYLYPPDFSVLSEAEKCVRTRYKSPYDIQLISVLQVLSNVKNILEIIE